MWMRFSRNISRLMYHASTGFSELLLKINVAFMYNVIEYTINLLPPAIRTHFVGLDIESESQTVLLDAFTTRKFVIIASQILRNILLHTYLFNFKYWAFVHFVCLNLLRGCWFFGNKTIRVSPFDAVKHIPWRLLRCLTGYGHVIANELFFYNLTNDFNAYSQWHVKPYR